MIYYFSATGNSKYVALKLARELDDRAADLLPLLAGEAPIFLPENAERVGLVSPTYACGLPTVVVEFLRRLRVVEGKKKPWLFFIATYGTTPGATGHQASRLLRRAVGVPFDAWFSVKMPDTWTPMFDLSNRKAVNRINRKAEDEIATICQHTADGQSGDYMLRQLPRFVLLFYWLYYNSMRKTRHFSVEDTCIGCSQCARKCPVQAIEMKAGKPVWVKKQCVMCLGCLHRCPRFAIQYGSHTKQHGQYTNPHVRV